MTLRIHNTLTNSEEEFKPIEPGKVKMYVCGVTVYDDIHMGHARSMIVFDMVARYLRYSGYEVTHVTNFTDVDDKIINRAAEEGIDPLELSARYIDRYFEDTKKLGLNRADFYPKASECIGDIIDMVQRIIDNGYAYVADDGSVYFEVAKVKDYGTSKDDRAVYSSFSGDFFKRFDGGLRFGCGAGYDIFYLELAFDLGLSNICHDMFDTSRNRSLTLNFGVNF